jgi:hypothetical protein
VPSCRSISVRSVRFGPTLESVPLLRFTIVLRLAPALRTLFSGTLGLMPKWGSVAGSTLRSLATAEAREWPSKTFGWQKMFIRRASELLQESSSIHCQSLRARERREAVWTFERRRSQVGLAQMLM